MKFLKGDPHLVHIGVILDKKNVESNKSIGEEQKEYAFCFEGLTKKLKSKSNETKPFL